MSTPFLTGFVTRVVVALLAGGHLEVVPGSEERVIAFVAGKLSSSSQGSQLIDSLSRALIVCPEVEELFIDDDDLKELITELQQP